MIVIQKTRCQIEPGVIEKDGRPSGGPRKNSRCKHWLPRWLAHSPRFSRELGGELWVVGEKGKGGQVGDDDGDGDVDTTDNLEKTPLKRFHSFSPRLPTTFIVLKMPGVLDQC